jgi:hypothetical protein
MSTREGKAGRLALEFADLPADQEPPKVVVHVLDREGDTIHRAESTKAGEVSLPANVLDRAHKITLSAADAEEGAQPAMVLRAYEVQALMEEGNPLAISKSQWGSLYGWRTCVDGSVKHCLPFPYVIESLALQTQINKLAFPPPVRPPFWPRCETVCDGEVIVYQRTCCCGPWIIKDPRLQDLIDRLKELLQQQPPIKWPPPPPPPDGWQTFPPRPGPGPDPVPPELEGEQLGFLRGGAISRAALHAEVDIEQLQSLEGESLRSYVAEREYLRPFWCTCGAPQQVGVGRIRPDGTFNICWWAPRIFLRPNCHHEYAFVVRQNINGSTVTIYDGVAANKWFTSTSGIELVSWDWRAVGCRGNPFPGESGAVVILQDIGATESWRLKTPNQDTWDSVLPPAFNDGLLDPVATLAAAKGNYHNSNWGGTLALRYHFSEPLKGQDGIYYRVSVVRADASGNPTGTRSYYASPLSWLYFEIIGTDYWVQSDSLGPQTIGGEANLYRIPYDADRDWHDGQYHAFIDTTAFANDRYLIMIEIFDATGNKIRPNGSSGPGADKDFTFRRWYQQIGPTANVPYAALTHMFWWDNRAAVAELTGTLRKDGNPSGGQCQFILGDKDPTTGSKFSADYRAYHPNEMFIVQHNLWWKRGIGGGAGTTGDISWPPPPPPSPRYDNVGMPPAAAGTTPQVPFATMLGPEEKCSFALNLHVDVKTTNGSGVLTYLDANDQGAFALLT